MWDKDEQLINEVKVFFKEKNVKIPENDSDYFQGYFIHRFENPENHVRLYEGCMLDLHIGYKPKYKDQEFYSTLYGTNGRSMATSDAFQISEWPYSESNFLEEGPFPALLYKEGV